ncbi:VCBS repeat-containing protein [Candidatus Sumerlaeota bacterium]|nr:VCBS repeat-containing protein [Candidatus Sumerlaeota bacterium]
MTTLFAKRVPFASILAVLFVSSALNADLDLQRIKYRNPGLVVDLGVGLWAWPLPMDYDGDGDLDLVVSCHDAPNRAIFFFENPDGNVKMPIFKPPVVVGPSHGNIQVSYVDDKPRVLIPGSELVDFRQNQFKKTVKIYKSSNVHDSKGRIRSNQWRYCDYDGDGKLDLIVGVEDWADYGWDDAFDKEGRWTRGPLHGHVYLLRNTGTTEKPTYAEPVKVEAGGRPIDTFGMTSPSFADFDGDGDLDLICGEFLDKFTYFQNIGARTKPEYAEGRFLAHAGRPITMDLEMIVPVAIDWDKDGDTDLVVGQEDGRVALVEHTGKVADGLPQFLPPQFFRQQAEDVKFGALVTPVGFDWDGDGDEDIVSGNTAGYIGVIENLDGGNPPKWAEPKYLEADGKVIRIQAGPNGSIQGPCEAKWGYTTLSVADWNHDSLPDIVANSILGRVVWFQNVGTRRAPRLSAARPVEVEWPGKPPKPAWTWWEPQGKELVPQWRTTPVVVDLTGDGLNDLVMLDHEGYLALFERIRQGGELKLLPGKRVFTMEGPTVFDSNHKPSGQIPGATSVGAAEPLRLNDGKAGRSGRRKLCFADWDGDGRLDLLVNSVNINFLRNVSTSAGIYKFADMGKVAQKVLAGHDTSPTVVDWDKNGKLDLVIGAEDGFFYYLKNPGAAP